MDTNGKSFTENRGGCAICQSDDHWKNECPERGGVRDRRAVKRGGSNSTRGRQGGRGGHGGQGGGMLVEVVMWQQKLGATL